MLKTLSIESAKPRKGGVRVGYNSRAKRNGIDDVEVDNDKVEDDEVEKKV